MDVIEDAGIETRLTTDMWSKQKLPQTRVDQKPNDEVMVIGEKPDWNWRT